MRHKPANRAHRKDYEIERVSHSTAAQFIKVHHYAKGCSNTSSEAFGLFRKQQLVGAAAWLPPTRVCAETVDPIEWRRVLSLSRLAVASTEPTNAESIFIGAMLRTLNKERRWTALVTFADESQGHEGTIYRATNWQYLGRTKPEPRWEDTAGKQVSRLSTKSRTANHMRSLGHVMVGRYSKHKYVYVLDIGLALAMVHWGESVRRFVTES